MKKFKYKAKDQNGKEVSGVLEAKSVDRVAESLQGQGLLVIDIRGEGYDFSKLSEINIGGIPMKDKVLFMRQFATMISAGISLNKALSILSQQVENPYFQRVVTDVVSDVEGGSSLAGAFKKHKGVFDNVVLGLLEAAEATGNLEEVLRILADELEEKDKLQTKIKSAFTYPAIIVVIMIAVIVLLMLVLVPAMSDMYADFDAELPWVTQVTIAVSDGMIEYWWLILAILGIVAIGIKLFIDTPRGKRSFHLLLLKMPLFGNLMVKMQLTQFTRTLSILLKSGLSIVEALGLTSDALSNVHFQNAVLQAKGEVEKGTPLAIPISRNEFFPDIIGQMISVGEESGALDGILSKMAELFNEEVNNIADNMATMLEPVMLVVMGAVIGFIALAVYSPMFGLAEVMM